MSRFGCQNIPRTLGLPLVILVGTMNLTGCAASRMMMRYGDLQTQTETSESVFLELRSELPNTVYLTEGSTAGRDFTVRPSLEQDLVEAGYVLVDTPDEATYLIQINYLRLAEVELSEDQTLGDALNAAMQVGAVATLGAALLDASADAATTVGIAAGVAGFIMDAKTKHIAHTLTTDVLVTETAPNAVGEPELRYHETRIVSGASKVNLDMEESLPAIVAGLSSSLSGLLPNAAREGGGPCPPTAPPSAPVPGTDPRSLR